jgi:hypothetical protein
MCFLNNIFQDFSRQVAIFLIKSMPLTISIVKGENVNFSVQLLLHFEKNGPTFANLLCRMMLGFVFQFCDVAKLGIIHK